MISEFTALARFLLLALAVASGVYSASTSADQVKTENMVVQGSACIGMDCVNGEDFTNTTLRLKENNLRVSFFATGATETSKTWTLLANSASNGGTNEFQFLSVSGGAPEPLFSDGFELGAPCSSGEEVWAPSPNLPVYEVVPYGDPVVVAEESDPFEWRVTDGVTEIKYTCSLKESIPSASLLRLADSSNTVGVALGAASRPLSGIVTVGNPSVPRKVKHLAAAEDSSDLINMQALADYKVMPEQSAAIDSVSVRVQAVSATILELEKSVRTALPVPAFPPLALLVLAGLLGLTGVRSLRH